MAKIIELNTWKTTKIELQHLHQNKKNTKQTLILYTDMSNKIRTLSDAIDRMLKDKGIGFKFFFQDKMYEFLSTCKTISSFTSKTDLTSVDFYYGRNTKDLERVELFDYPDTKVTIFDKAWTNEQLHFIFKRFGLKPLKKMENPKTISEVINLLKNGSISKEDFILQEGIIFQGNLYKFSSNYEDSKHFSISFSCFNSYYSFVDFHFCKNGELESIHFTDWSRNNRFKGYIYHREWAFREIKDSFNRYGIVLFNNNIK